jgi:hypothetical protein
VFYGEHQHEHGARRVAAHALVLESGLDFLVVTHTMLIVAAPSFTSPQSFQEDGRSPAGATAPNAAAGTPPESRESNQRCGGAKAR